MATKENPTEIKSLHSQHGFHLPPGWSKGTFTPRILTTDKNDHSVCVDSIAMASGGFRVVRGEETILIPGSQVSFALLG